MNFEEKNVRQDKLKEEALEKTSGGISHAHCYCPRCKNISWGAEGSLCPFCELMGIESHVVRD